jgi:hypothetical protein
METSFTGSARLGDTTYRIIGAEIRSMDWSCDRGAFFIEHDVCIPSPWHRAELTIRLDASAAKVVMETNDNLPKIRNKQVKDCSIEELLFAIQTKLNKL